MGFFVFWAVVIGLAAVAWFATSRTVIAWLTPKPELHGVAAELQFAEMLLANPMWLANAWDQLELGSPMDGWPTVQEIHDVAAGLRMVIMMPLGHSAAVWQAKADKIADTFAVTSARVIGLGSGLVRVDLVVFDTLVSGERVPDPAAAVDLEAVECGVTEDGGLWLLAVLYRHLLFAGVSGAGKSSAVWAVIAGLGPAIRSGLVELWGIDPKVVELTPGKDLFNRLVVGADEAANALLVELVTVMQERLDRMAATGSRKHVPTVDEPLIVMWIDEVLALTAFAPDKKVREQADRLIRLLMSQGRAAAISLIVCSQDPSKEIMTWRQMVTLRIGLRMDEATQTAMVLGQGARDRGARCDEIPPTTPGVAFVGEDGRTDFQRVRAYLVTDDDIAALAQFYAPEQRPIQLDNNKHDTDLGDDIPGDGEGHGREAA